MKSSLVGSLTFISTILCSYPFLLLLVSVNLGFPLIYLLLFLVPGVLLIWWLIGYLKKRVINPIRQLTEEANLIAGGDLAHPITYQKKDELGQFVAAFEQMRGTLYQQQQQQEQFEIQRKSFINNISHDLKTPIASISGYIEALQDKLAATPEEEQQYLQIIENKLTVLTELSKQLDLTYTTPETMIVNLQGVSCYRWATKLLESAAIECQLRGIQPTIINEVQPVNQKQLLIDRLQLERAIQNILSNSFRYFNQHFVILAEIHQQSFILQIENDGVTIGADYGDKIFERFYTEEGKGANGHLGLGLSIAKNLIQAMGGQITAKIQSNIIQFKVVLPLSDSGEA